MTKEFLYSYWLESLFALVVLTTLGFWIASLVVRYKDNKKPKPPPNNEEPMIYHSPRERK